MTGAVLLFVAIVAALAWGTAVITLAVCVRWDRWVAQRDARRRDGAA